MIILAKSSSVVVLVFFLKLAPSHDSLGDFINFYDYFASNSSQRKEEFQWSNINLLRLLPFTSKTPRTGVSSPSQPLSFFAIVPQYRN
jgi:hypothetical protein